jgi:hypothetical protein
MENQEKKGDFKKLRGATEKMSAGWPATLPVGLST